MNNQLFDVPGGGRASADFKLSITRALADQLDEKLNALVPAPLAPDQLELLEPRPGVYQLYLDEEMVYVGKAAKSLPERLGKHHRKLSGRMNIDTVDVGFVCLYVDEDMDAAAPEKLLIKRYRAKDEAPWNTMGFGNKDPGHNRDKTLVKAKHFDAQYPIDTTRRVHGLKVGDQPLGPALMAAKGSLPYTFRFQTKNKAPHPELRDARIVVPDGPLTAAEFVQLVLEVVPDGWQATALPGYMILYREFVDYGSATQYWRRIDGHVVQVAGEGLFDERGEVDSGDEDDD